MTAKKCPICGKPETEAFRPFCSKRCADIDLNRWFSEGYTTPAVELDDINPDDLPDVEN